MKTIIIMLISTMSILVLSQTKYEIEMQKAFTKWDTVQTAAGLEKVSQHFKRIAQVEKENWIPLYYQVLTETLNAFSLEKEDALAQVDDILLKYDALSELENNSEVSLLKGIILTVKVAKDPMVYGQTLSPEIMNIYQEVLTQDPQNPRAMYLLAQYQMGGAKFWGKDPKAYCPEMVQAKILLENEKKENFEPSWGKKEVMKILDTTCNEEGATQAEEKTSSTE